MIIKFDQTPEEYFRLSKLAYGRGEFDRALLYAEKAVRGRASAEYKIFCAEVLTSMGRFAEASNVALDVLCYSRTFRAEAFDVLARCSGELGHFYESLHYIAKKAHYEGDDDTLDAMDEVMEELSVDGEPPADGPDFFVVGKETPPAASDATLAMRANFALSHGDADEAIRIASEAQKGSDQYAPAMIVCLRAYLKKKENDRAVALAEEIVRTDPKNGFVLYVLIDKFKKKEYAPLLVGVADGGSELYYAILTAENLSEHDVSCRLAEKLVQQNLYVPGAYFVAAATYLNNGNKTRSEDFLKRLFALYGNYPQETVLKGWRRLKKCSASFPGRMPVEVTVILERYVLKSARNAEEFEKRILTEEEFRNAVRLVLDEGSRHVNEKIVAYFGETENRIVDEFFAKTLIRYEVDLLLKRAVFAKLYEHKDKGWIYVAQSVVPIRVSSAKPKNFKEWQLCVQRAYCEVFAFLMCMTDADCEKRLQALAERVARVDGAEDLSVQTVVGAFMYRLFAEGNIPFGTDAKNEAEACKFVLNFVFGMRKINLKRIRLLAAILAD